LNEVRKEDIQTQYQSGDKHWGGANTKWNNAI